MSDYNPHHGHDPHDPDHGQVESSSVSPKPVLLFLAVLFISTAFVFFVVKGMDWGFKKLDESKKEQYATEIKTQDRKLPPSPMPLLQGAPGRDSTATTDKPTDLPLEAMENLRKSTDEKLSSYGWVDKPGGIAHVPIDRAKDMIAEKGLPTLQSTAITEEVQTAETVRKEVLNAGSNAGRVISVQKPTQRPVPQPAQQPAPQSAQPQSARPQQNQQVQPQQH
jgi:cytoskeletal protein RodZ